MKCKTVVKNLTLFMLIVCILLVSVFCASAVDDTSENINSQVETQGETQEETTPEPETEFIPEETGSPSEEETEASEEEPEKEETESENYTEEVTEEQQNETEETQANVQENINDGTVQTKTLPTVAQTTEKRVVNKDDLTYGYVSWTCVAAGILVLIIVFISIKSSGIKQSKRKRR